MSLWEEALAFKEKNGLFFHPLHDSKKRFNDIEHNDRRCPCGHKRRCICDQAIEDCKEKGACACLMFVTKEYLLKWCYVDKNGRVLSEKERKLWIIEREKRKKRVRKNISLTSNDN
jgi:hypothetical protein